MIDQFLQTKAWAKFQAAYGRKIHWIDDLLLIRMPLPMGKCYLYSPRGPQLKHPTSTIQHPNKNQEPITNWQKLVDQVNQFAKEQDAIFWRLEPNYKLPLGFARGRQATTYKLIEVKPVQPKHEWILDIIKSEEELLKQMKPKTRYNIKLAERKGVKVRVSDSLADFDSFWCLVNQTIQRKGMRPHQKRYYQRMIEVLGQNQEVQLKLYLAEYQSKIICANIMVFSGNCANYVHGASADEYRNVMAPYLIQWRAIQDAKSQGYQYYNFGGVNPESSDDQFYLKSWEGITRFKQGFFGQWVSHPGTFDLPISRFWYRLYRLLKAMF